MLKQEIEERSLPLWHTPPQSTAPPQSRASGTRLDRAEAEKVLELAGRLQSAERDGLSVAQIEGLAAERGIAAHHVRRAMAMQGHEAATPVELSPIRLSRAQWQVVSLTILFVWLYATVAPVYFPGPQHRMQLLPLLLSIMIGAYLRHKRAGLVAGTAVAFAVCIGVASTLLVAHGADYTWFYFSVATGASFFTFFLLSMIVGAMGAALRQWMTDRQPFYVSTVVKTPKSER